MTILWILVASLLTYNFGKWLLLLIVAPVIVFDSKRRRNKSIEIFKKDIEYIKTVSKNECPAPTISANNKVGNKLMVFLTGHLEGLERYFILQTGFIPSHFIRNFIYKRIFLVRMSKRSVIYYGAEIRGPYNLILGEGAIVGDRGVLDARRGYIKIGNNVQLGNSVSLWTGSHDYNDPWFRSMPGKRGPIEIEDYVWIGAGVTVLHSVKIGKGAVIASGAVVTKDVEPFSIMAGIPAKKIGTRNCDLVYELGKAHLPFY